MEVTPIQVGINLSSNTFSYDSSGSFKDEIGIYNKYRVFPKKCVTAYTALTGKKSMTGRI